METWMLAEPAMEVATKRKGTLKDEKKNNGQERAIKVRAISKESADHHLVIEMGKQILSMDNQMRQHEAVILTTIALPSTMPEAVAMKAAGIAYNQQAQALGKSHGLGSPHLRVWAALVMTLIKKKEISQQLAEALKAHAAAATTPMEIGSLVLHCRMTQMKNSERSKLQIAVALALTPTWSLMLQHLLGCGGELLLGSAPRGPHIREIQKTLMSMNAFNDQ
jgi:hypothetical protein